MFPDSGWARWLIIPLNVSLVLLFLPDGAGIALLAYLGVMFLLGMLGQRFFPDTSVNRRLFYLLSGGLFVCALGVTVLVGGGGLAAWFGLYVVIFTTLPASAAGSLLTNVWLARSSIAAAAGSTAGVSGDDRRGLSGLLIRANEMTKPSLGSSEENTTARLPMPEAVLVYVDGVWRAGSLMAWQVRDLQIYAQVALADGPSAHAEWVRADRVRRSGESGSTPS